MLMTVMYPAGETFDEAYYTSKHMPLVRERWSNMGMTDSKVLRGVPGPDGAAAPFTIMTILTFDTMDHFKAAAAKYGDELFGDIPNFTKAKPTVQFNDQVE